MEGGLAVIILAGGASRRLGANKPLEKVGERSMLAQVIMTASNISDEVVVVTGNPFQEALYREEIPHQIVVVHDKIHQKGPLVGLYTGLEIINSEYAAVLPSDCPFVKKEVVLCLYGMAKGRDAAVPIWADGRVEPLHSVFRVTSAKKAAVEAMKAEMDTIREMIQQMDKVEFVPIEKMEELDPPLLTFLNINTRADLERARRIAREVGRTEQAMGATDRR